MAAVAACLPPVTTPIPSRRSDGWRKDEELLKWLNSLESLCAAQSGPDRFPRAVWRPRPQNDERHKTGLASILALLNAQFSVENYVFCSN
jgi:hypothetical protein